MLVASVACASTHQIEDLKALSDRFGSIDERFADAFLFDQKSISLRLLCSGLRSAARIIGTR